MCNPAGENFGDDGDAATATAMKAIQEAAAEEGKQRLAEKAAKKAAFNAEYDVGKLQTPGPKPRDVRVLMS